MPKIRAYLGPAGSGKTFALMEEVKRISAQNSINSTQSILAITFMHGSRRRLSERLHEFSRKGFSTQCDTIDSFCLQMVNRFRRYRGVSKPIAISPSETDDTWREGSREWKASFTSVRLAAIELLKSATVRLSVAAAYPIIIVDEFQDCESSLLDVVGLLAIESHVILAADEFQHLSPNIECPARIWLNNADADIVELTSNRRTSDNVLLESASALREGRASTNALGVHLIVPGLAAWEISSRLSWGQIPAGKSKAIICPVKPTKSSWFQGILDSLCRELGKKSKVGPNPFKWHGGEHEHLEEALAFVMARCETSESISPQLLDEFERADNYIVRATARQAIRLVGLRGEDGVLMAEFRDMLQRTSHSAISFRRESQNARHAMTVHGAKNREFDFVFIVWPYEVPGNPLFARKLMYNAVTRAKEGAVLFVQGDKKRMKQDETLALLQSGIVEKASVPVKAKKRA
jgi:superfamily I DNA/RNA helicase